MFKYVLCVENLEYEVSLEKGKVYRQIPDDRLEIDGDIRVIDESGEDYIYPKDMFVDIMVSESALKMIFAESD